jgi:hypothetical protein
VFVDNNDISPFPPKKRVVEKSVTKKEETIPILGARIFVESVEIVNRRDDSVLAVKRLKFPNDSFTRFASILRIVAWPVENVLVERESGKKITRSNVERPCAAFPIRPARIESESKLMVVRRNPPVIDVESVLRVPRNPAARNVEREETFRNEVFARLPDKSSTIQLEAEKRVLESVEIVASVVERIVFMTKADGIVICWISALRVDCRKRLDDWRLDRFNTPVENWFAITSEAVTDIPYSAVVEISDVDRLSNPNVPRTATIWLVDKL